MVTVEYTSEDERFDGASTSFINLKKTKLTSIGIQCDIENDYLRRDNRNELSFDFPSEDYSSEEN